MDIFLLLKAVIMGIVEGITEFLPISSTGHLILTAHFLDFWTKEKADLFTVAIQMGAILAVIFEYWSKLWGAATGIVSGEKNGRHFGFAMMMASVPIVLVGLTFGEKVQEFLFTPITVAIGFIVGGLIIWWVEKHPVAIQSHEVEQISFKQAIIIGCIQVLSLIPGTSRSGASMIGAMCLGVSRKASTEFSFFLGIPVLIGAGLLDLYKQHRLYQTAEDWTVFATGLITSFIVAFFFIRILVVYVSKKDLMVFAYYRIIAGVVLLALAMAGFNLGA